MSDKPKSKRRKRLTVDEALVHLLREMFRRVGEDYDEWKDTVCKDNPEWYTARTWTEAEESDFSAWAVQYLRDNLRWTKSLAEREMQWFCLMWSWSYKQGAQ